MSGQSVFCQRFSSVWLPVNICLYVNFCESWLITYAKQHESLEATLGSYLQLLWSEFLSCSYGICLVRPSRKREVKHSLLLTNETFIIKI